MSGDDGVSFTPLPVYAGCEDLGGRLRAPVPKALLLATCDHADHDPGDEDRR